jgi:uncharacterized protein (UPF0264 family)
VTGLLASVTSAAEAELALAGGADIIDLKDPSAGALGALPVGTSAEAVRRIDGRRPVSATVGDLPMVPDLVSRSVRELSTLGVDFVKVGLFPGGDRDACLEQLAEQAAAGTRIVIVLFADLGPDFALVDRLADLEFAGVMLDTARKDGGGLRRHLDDDALRRFVLRARGHRLLVGLAGSLDISDVPPLVRLRPDYLGFRGALCTGGREGRLDPRRLAEIRTILSQCEAGYQREASAAMAAAGAQRAAHSFVSASPSMNSAKSR